MALRPQYHTMRHIAMGNLYENFPRTGRLMLAAADCLLVNELPGVANMAVPSKLTSYFDAARPVLAATEVDGITASEIAQAEAGMVVPAGDPHALLAAAIEISCDSEQSDVYGASARRFCRERLTADAAIGAFERVVREVAYVATEAPASTRNRSK